MLQVGGGIMADFYALYFFIFIIVLSMFYFHNKN